MTEKETIIPLPSPPILAKGGWEGKDKSKEKGLRKKTKKQTRGVDAAAGKRRERQCMMHKLWNAVKGNGKGGNREQRILT